MSIARGIDSKIVVGTTVVAKLNSMDISHSNNSVETKYFQEEGSTFSKTGETLTISCKGNLIAGGADAGQNTIITAAASGTGVIPDIKFYEEGSGYWYEADTSSNPDSVFIVDGFSIGSEAGSFISFAANFKCSGDYKRVNA